MKEQYTTTVDVAGKGDTQAKAFAAALSQVQNKILQSTGNVLLRIEPQDVSVQRAEVRSKREKFLFFFFPRDRKTFTVSLKVTVNVTILNLEKVTFEQK